jgi:endonuclease/exonuclease/phosphatase (EEP) superfamily protein YafD
MVGWLVVAPLALVAAVRVIAWDEVDSFVLANSLAGPLYVPAWIVALFAFIARKRALTLASLGVVFAHSRLLAPELAAARRIPEWALRAPSITLFCANILADNANAGDYAAAISKLNPDLVALQESTPRAGDQLSEAGAFTELPYRVTVARPDPWAFIVASRYPLRDARVVSMCGQPYLVQMTVELPDDEITLWVVHTTSPLPRSRRRWAAQLSRIAALVQVEGPSRLLMVGDFNATWGNRNFQNILVAGLADGAATHGKPFLMTWPQRLRWPPLIRIDHVLTGQELEVLSMHTGHGPGSDHRYLATTIAVKKGNQLPVKDGSRSD